MNVAPAIPTPRLQAVLLWDLDNMPGPREHRLTLAQELHSSVEVLSPRVAASRRGAYRELKRWLVEAGVEVLSGGRSRSGADRRLCDRGRAFARQGHRAFVVVSNDGYFSCLARVGGVHVITLDLERVNTRLAAVATTITTMDFDDSCWVRRTVDENLRGSQQGRVLGER